MSFFVIPNFMADIANRSFSRSHMDLEVIAAVKILNIIDHHPALQGNAAAAVIELKSQRC